MILKRREKLPFWQRVREAVAPRKGWRRGFDYIGKRMKRLPDTPHRIALGFAFGAFVSFTPFFTMHFVLAALLAWICRANILAGLFGTAVGNPLTFPFIAAVSLWLGNWIMGTHVSAEEGEKAGFSLGWLWNNFTDIFVPYLVGGILPGLICAVACYWLLRPLVAAYQNRRRKKLAARREARRAALRGEVPARRSLIRRKARQPE